ncbi:MAG: HTH domain-containing protein [Acidimicrobiia bacterium]|nr:HTH domain-containing protein [Acidimicrobiia bacterium]
MRAGRLIHLTRLLQARGQMTASELAAELEVSTRTVLRDIEALSGAGVAVYSVRGPNGGFTLLGGTDAETSAWPVRSSSGARATVRLSPQGRRVATLLGRPRIQRVRRTAGPDGWVEATLRFDALDAAVHELLALGPEVEVLRPADLRKRLAASARHVAALNGAAGDGGRLRGRGSA